MATQKVSTQAEEGKDIPAWKKDRIEMTRLVWANILDPIMTFAELVRGYDRENGLDLSPEEICDILRLIVLGGYTEPKLYCTWGGTLRHITGDMLEDEVKNWEKGGDWDRSSTKEQDTE